MITIFMLVIIVSDVKMGVVQTYKIQYTVNDNNIVVSFIVSDVKMETRSSDWLQQQQSNASGNLLTANARNVSTF